MAICGTIIVLRTERGVSIHLGFLPLGLWLVGTAVILYSFVADTGATLGGLMPQPYHYELLGLGLLLYVVAFSTVKTSTHIRCKAMTFRPSPRVHPVESMLMAAVIIWAANYPVSKYGLSGLGVFVFNALRFVVASLFLVLLFVRRFRWMPVARRDWMKLLGLGVLANVIYQAAFVAGLNLTTSGNAAVLLSTSPLWTVLFDARINKQPITAGMIWGMPCRCAA